MAASLVSVSVADPHGVIFKDGSLEKAIHDQLLVIAQKISEVKKEAHSFKTDVDRVKRTVGHATDCPTKTLLKKIDEIIDLFQRAMHLARSVKKESQKALVSQVKAITRDIAELQSMVSDVIAIAYACKASVKPK